MITDIIFRAFLIAIAFAGLTLLFEAGQWFAHTTQINWVNAVLITFVIVLAADAFRRNLLRAAYPDAGFSLSEVGLNLIAWAVFILVLDAPPSTLGAAQWDWTYLTLERSVAYHNLGRYGTGLWIAWDILRFSTLIFFLTGSFFLLMALLDRLGFEIPDLWVRITKEEELNQRCAQLFQNNERLTEDLKRLTARATAAEAEAERATAQADEDQKRAQALRQELVRSGVTLERAQDHLRKQNEQNSQMSVQVAQAQQALDAARQKACQQDDYIALLLKRLATDAGQSKNAPQDADGYRSHPDNAFAALLEAKPKPVSPNAKETAAGALSSIIDPGPKPS